MYLNVIITGVQKKKRVFTDYYEKLTNLNFEALYSALISARILNHTDSSAVLHATDSSKAALHVLDKISVSLRTGVDNMFDEFLLVLEDSDNIANTKLAENIRRDLLSSTTGIPSLSSSVAVGTSFELPAGTNEEAISEQLDNYLLLMHIFLA